jgi:hypothetical protein
MGATSPGNPGGTKINGSLSAPVFEFAFGTKIDVQLGAGNDSVRVFGKAGQSFASPININTSNSLDPALDNDFVSVRNLFTGHKLDITTGVGADVVKLENSTTGNLTLRAGSSTPGRADADQVSVVNTTAFGNVLVTTGEGNDVVTVKSLNLPLRPDKLGRHLTVDAGAGADTIKVGSNLLGTPNPDLTPVTVSGVVHIIAGTDAQADADVVQMQDVLADQFMTVELGGGNDRLDLFRSSAGKAISLGGQKGDDTINVREVETLDGFYAFLGEGSDTLNIVNLKATVKAEFNGGDGFDRLFLSQSPSIPLIVRSAFEEINGQKLISKTTLPSLSTTATR